ncbi:acyl-CoA Delta(11) desaturase-like [Copidosoma floridanum]|uniref:acyl-CoA Delta(11) desaturase-like n=1 Tax=Copidosoma floridanum TaxID=29053 RepID=UPI0006C979B7|nr:acyl-CoA Delta(11) desaturase-like [Copidosoma floridanum]
MIVLVHVQAVCTLFTFPYIQHGKTTLWTLCIGLMAGFGITGGIHRYWSHRSYKANTPLKIILTICYLMAGQNSMYQWVRDHRVHHKYSETDADPHNSNRGFFFSHVGWLMLKKHPEVLRKGKQIDMSDIENDPVASFAERYFMPLKLMASFIIPMVVPVYCWNEDWYYAIVSQITRYVYVLNATWSVNSFAHFFGNKPYNKVIAPAENTFVSYIAFGEGWHNYHHTFPSDYRAAELGGGRVNKTTKIIDLFAKIGWAYDLNVPSDSLVKAIIANRGDGTHESLRNETSKDK